MLKLQEFSSLRELIKKFPIVEALVGKMGAILEPMVQDPEEIFAAPVLADLGPIPGGYLTLVAQVWWQDTRAPDAPYGITFCFAPADAPDDPRVTTEGESAESERELARFCRKWFPEVFSGEFVPCFRVKAAADQNGTAMVVGHSWGKYRADDLLKFMDGGPVSELRLYDYRGVCLVGGFSSS